MRRVPRVTCRAKEYRSPQETVRLYMSVAGVPLIAPRIRIRVDGEDEGEDE